MIADDSHKDKLCAGDICEQFGIVKYKKGRKKRVLVTSKEGVNEGYGPAYSGEELTLKMRSQKYNNSQRSSGDNPKNKKKNRAKKNSGTDKRTVR